MRYLRCLLTAALACAVLAGCGSAQRSSQRRLAEKTDLARRLYSHATTLLTIPPYMDRKTGQRSPVSRRLPDADLDVPTAGTIGDPKVEQLLNKAESTLAKAISDNPQAPAGTISDARYLLGEIQLAKGRYRGANAERHRKKIAELQAAAYSQLAMIRENTILAEFVGAFATQPRDKIEAARDGTAEDLDRLTAEIAKIDARTASLEKENSDLAAANTAPLERARSMRDRGEVAGGPEGLELLKKAQALEAKVNENANQIAANQQAIEVLEADRSLVEQARRNAASRLATVTKHLEGMDKHGAAAASRAEAASRRAANGWQEVQTLIGEIASSCRALAEEEDQAVADLEKAVKNIAAAERAARRQIDAAKAAMMKTDRSNEMLEGLSDDQYLASIITQKGLANLALGDLRSRRIVTAWTNDSLAEKVLQVSGLLGRGETPPEVVAMKGYLEDVEKTKGLADKDYERAEKDLNVVLKSYARGQVGRKTAWINQALLANAYLGHFRLTGERTVLDKAARFVAEALAGKEGSPYLEPVVELQLLIRKAGV